MVSSIGRLVAGVGLLMSAVLLAQSEDALNSSERLQLARILAPLSDVTAKNCEATERRRTKYVADLKTLEVEVARSGDLDAVKAVRAEREAWENGESTPGFDAMGKFALAKVATLRKQLDGALQTEEKQAKGAMDQERTKAINALERMKVELTRATRIDAALELDKQIQSLKDGTFEVPATMVGQGDGDRGGRAPGRLSGDTTSKPSEASKSRPFVNSLGMPFVPIKGTKVLFCIWETRVKDFDAFVKGSGYSWNETAGFEQTPEDPVVKASWNDAKAFCDWLSKKEGKEYRLPTDKEWDVAAGKEEFPWGKEWPPPKGAGNFAGDESKRGQPEDPKDEDMTQGWHDDYPRTAPVGSCKPTKSGLYDLSGNVWEWCEDWYTEEIHKKHKEGGGLYFTKPEEIADIKKGDVRKVLRGGSWDHSIRGALRSSSRPPHIPDSRLKYNGFRCVVVASP